MSTGETAAETVQTVTSVFANISTLGLARILTIVALIIGCIIVKKILMKVAAKAIDKLKVERSLHTFIKSLLNILLWFIIILIVADSIGIPVTSLLAVLSLAGLAVSLAIQGTLSNLAGGIMILLAKPFVVGDFVETAGVSGTVADIGLVYTKMTTVDNKAIFVPNSEISGAKVSNFTHQERRRVDLVFSASYEAPVETVEGLLRDVLEKQPKVLKDPAIFVSVSKFGSSAIEYTLRAWCATADYWDVYFDLLHQVKRAFDESGVEMTYDHLNVHLKRE